MNESRWQNTSKLLEKTDAFYADDQVTMQSSARHMQDNVQATSNANRVKDSTLEDA
jgi:ectoine hydroxylase-related dioxygenase (phytanoyl-CoA dioxygenase family)